LEEEEEEESSSSDEEPSTSLPAAAATFRIAGVCGLEKEVAKFEFQYERRREICCFATE